MPDTVTKPKMMVCPNSHDIIHAKRLGALLLAFKVGHNNLQTIFWLKRHSIGNRRISNSQSKRTWSRLAGSNRDRYKRLASLTRKTLRLRHPVEHSTKFELVINLQASPTTN
jgi:hypothetical protein